jgi:hypothetical protein
MACKVTPIPIALFYHRSLAMKLLDLMAQLLEGSIVYVNPELLPSLKELQGYKLVEAQDDYLFRSL